jgi:hypothetical protein
MVCAYSVNTIWDYGIKIMYTLTRERDGVGDSGGMSMALWLDDEGNLQYEKNARPRVGVAMRVGSIFARTMTAQDWWQTTPVSEILDDRPGYVKFKTRNGSTYVWTNGEEEDEDQSV